MMVIPKNIVSFITLSMISGFALTGEEDDIDVDKMLYGEGIEADMYRAGVDDVEQARAWFAALKNSIETRDEEQLITMIHFPVIIASDTGSYKIDNPEEFLSQYDQVITPRLKSIVDCSSFDQLWANYSGISVGSGVIIFESIYLNDEDTDPVLKVRLFYNGALMGNDLRKCGEAATEPAEQRRREQKKRRIYGLSLARFLQADPIIQNPRNSRNLNRYSYV